MKCYDVVVGHLGGNISKAGESYRIERGVIILRIPFRVKALCEEIPEISEEAKHLPGTIEDVLFQNAIV